MDRREARREILYHLAVIEERRDKLLDLTVEADSAGEVILAEQLRRYTDKLTELVDQLYVWAGNL